MKIKTYTFLFIIFGILLFISFYAFIKYIDINNNTTYNNNNTYIVNVNNSTISTPGSINNENLTVTIPPNDYIINNINWSSYPNLQTGYIHLAQIMEPNEYVTHKYVAVGVMTEVKNTNNSTIIFEQLSKVARDVRRICGPNTAIVIFGMDHGVNAWTVTMRVDDDHVY